MDDAFDYCFPMLRKMGNKLERIEEEIFEGRGEEIVRDISNAKQEIINFRKIIRPQRAVLGDLERTKQRYIADDLEIYFDDINDASERIWDMLENYKEVVEALEDTNESVISHRVNEVLKVLTAFSVVILPLTLVASICRDERGRSRSRHAAYGGVLGDRRRDGGHAGRDARVLPPPRLPLARRLPARTLARGRPVDLQGVRRPWHLPRPDGRGRGLPDRAARSRRCWRSLEGKPVGDLRVAIGRDMRLTAPAMAARYAEGLAHEGVDVLDIGMVGTEMVYWTVGSRELDGGISCTASHNPKAYTGAKLVRSGALALSGDSGIGELRELVAAGEPGPPVAEPGEVRTEDVGEAFRAAALEYIDAARIAPLKVVLDGGNGMAGPMLGPLLDSFPIEQIQTYWEPDGEFPDHEPNPLLEENRRFIVDKVRAEGADLGIAWDGDADRCFFIDDTGEFVDGDFLTALLAESLLGKEPGATVLYDVRASRAVRDVVERAGGAALVNRVGHAFFKSRMRETGAVFGGEVSGHYYFRDFYCADSGTLPALLILELLSHEGKPLSELLRPLRERYFISGEINSEVEDQDGEDARDRRPLRGGRGGLARRGVGGVRGLALQRPPVEHRAAAAAEPGVGGLAGAHGGEARRGAGPHPGLAASTASKSPAAVASAE